MYFRTLRELGEYVEKADAYLVDPGIPLGEYVGDGVPPAWRNQPSVRKVTDFAARLIAAIPLHLYQRTSDTDRTRVTDHALARMLTNPSGLSYDTPYRFWYRVLLDGLIADRWAALKISDSDGTPRLTRIPARRFRFSGDGLDRIEKVVVYNDEGDHTKYKPERFALDVGYATRGANGTSPLVTLRELLDESAEAIKYRKQMLRGGARMPGIVMRDKAWPSKAARDRFIAGWSAYSGDGMKAGRDGMLEDGMSYEQLTGFKPVDLEALEGRRLTDVEVAGAYHIAPELVGAREGNYSNMDAFRQSLYVVNLGPYITAWTQAVNAAFRDDLGAEDLYIEPHMDSVLRGSQLEQADFAVKATGRPWMATAELRPRFNLPDIGGDTHELITPLNVLVGGQANATDSGDQNKKAAAQLLRDLADGLEG